MISTDAFAQEIRALTDTAFAVSYLILGNRADCEDTMSEAILRAYEGRDKLKRWEAFGPGFCGYCETKPIPCCANDGG